MCCLSLGALLPFSPLDSKKGFTSVKQKMHAVRSDFDGDGRTDFVTVSASGKDLRWAMMRSSKGFRHLRFGLNATDEPVPGDFDGDGTTDPAVWRPLGNGSAEWRILSAGVTKTIKFGLADDQPLVGDFNGDGRDEQTVVRATNGQLVWSTFGFPVSVDKKFGLGGDMPIVGDFDGDGADDCAILRVRGDGSWERRYIPSSDRTSEIVDVFGLATEDLVMPSCDTNGDGRDDFVLFRGSSAEAVPSAPWFVSPNLVPAAKWGIGGTRMDRPVPGDYDGDGRCDFSVFRPSEGRWYVRFSKDGTTQITVTLGGFLPVPVIGVV